MEALRTEYTEVWISRPVAPLVLFADNVRALADTGIDLAGLPGLPVPPIFDSFDRIHSWYGTQREDFRAAVAHLPFIFYPALPTAPPSGVPRIGLSGPRHGSVILHPFSGSAKKNWPLEHFRELARQPGVSRSIDLTQCRRRRFGRWLTSHKARSCPLPSDSSPSRTGMAHGARLAYFGSGTRRRRSSNQFTITWISVDSPAVAEGFSIRNRLPSGATS